MKHTAGTAAKAVGKTKSTITKAIASGKISAVKNSRGWWEIEVAELHRVYPPSPADTVEIERIERHDTPVETGGNSREIEVLERLLKAAEEQLADVKVDRDDVKVDRDEWRKQAQAQNQLLLTTAAAPRKKLFGLF